MTKLIDPIVTVFTAFAFLWEIKKYEVNARTALRTVSRMELVCFLSFLEGSAKQLAWYGRLNTK
jgi:hypothetical protein